MSRFMNSTLTDLRHGRESWRVFLAVCAPSFAVTVVVLMLRSIH